MMKLKKILNHVYVLKGNTKKYIYENLRWINHRQVHLFIDIKVI